MLNRREMELALQGVKKELVEAVVKGNTRMQDQMINEMLRLQGILKGEDEKKTVITKEDKEIIFEIEEERVIRQSSIEKSFAKKLKEIVKAKEGTTVNPVSDRQ